METPLPGTVAGSFCCAYEEMVELSAIDPIIHGDL